LKKKGKDLSVKARNYAFLLLKFRPRSERELYERLKIKKFSLNTIKSTLSFLIEKKFLDDNYFAKAWIESRLKKPFGIRKIREELRIKGIDKEIIENQISRIKEDYAEKEVVLELAKKRLSRFKELDPQKAKARLWGYLMRRGFSSDIITEVTSELFIL
jgi:regulatory protein